MENLHICYKIRVKFQVRKLKRKSKNTYLESFTELAGKESDLSLKVAEICKKRKYELVRMVSHQAISVGFAFWNDRPGYDFLSDSEKKALPLPYEGKEIQYSAS